MGTWAYNLSYKRGINLGPHISYHIISYEIVSYHNYKHFQLSFQHPFHLSSLTWSRLNQELVVNNARCEQAGSCTGRVRYFMYIQYPLNLEILPR